MAKDEEEKPGLTALERMEELAVDYNLDAGSLISDVQGFLLEQIKVRPKPWSASTEDEQRTCIDACEHAANELVRKVVEAVAARGKKPVRVLLTKVALGDDITVTGKVKTLSEPEADEAVMTLHHSRNKIVMLTVASVEDYRGEGSDFEPDPDQPDLGFEAGDMDGLED